MDPDELLRKIDRGEAPVVVDVRTTREYTAGHVPGARHVPFQSVGARVTSLPADRRTPLVLYCGHGPRARIAAALLRLHGFTNLTYLKGHMAGWRHRHLAEER